MRWFWRALIIIFDTQSHKQQFTQTIRGAHLVVDVCDVHDKVYIVSKVVGQYATQDVLRNIVPDQSSDGECRSDLVYTHLA